jgi:hypothetical protein
LSESQNRKIISHLTRRLCALNLDRLSNEALNAFYGGVVADVLRIRRKGFDDA